MRLYFASQMHLLITRNRHAIILLCKQQFRPTGLDLGIVYIGVVLALSRSLQEGHDYFFQ
jgi:hypothetical protein